MKAVESLVNPIQWRFSWNFKALDSYKHLWGFNRIEVITTVILVGFRIMWLTSITARVSEMVFQCISPLPPRIGMEFDPPERWFSGDLITIYAAVVDIRSCRSYLDTMNTFPKLNKNSQHASFRRPYWAPLSPIEPHWVMSVIFAICNDISQTMKWCHRISSL